MECLNCKTETVNPLFCSKSCAAIYNNKKYPKRFKTKECKSCNTKIASSRTYCQKCYRAGLIDYNSLTLKELENDKGSRNRYTTCVRSHARSVAKKNNLGSKCQICGYDTYIECCHKKPVSSFSLNTKLEVVNAPTNLIILCPNHHKEHDLGLLKL